MQVLLENHEKAASARLKIRPISLGEISAASTSATLGDAAQEEDAHEDNSQHDDVQLTPVSSTNQTKQLLLDKKLLVLCHSSSQIKGGEDFVALSRVFRASLGKRQD
ncbi:unnamed protein product [Amoebophrya sp. A25]|nr:unnamed protein product [Amoebophrya sp. A25]|eukprot:GSA25T00011162001.1